MNEGRYVMFQMARVALSRQMFQEILHADRPVAGTARASKRSAVIRCDKRRQQRCASMQANCAF